MRLKFHLDEEVAGAPARARARALARQTYGLTRQNAVGHLHVEHALFRDQPPLGVDFGNPQSKGRGPSVQCSCQIQQYFGMVILTAPTVEAAPGAAAAAAA